MLEEMRWAVAHIERERVVLDREGFEKSESKQAAVAFFIMALGDAVGDVSRRTKNADPDIPWGDLAGRRYRPAHRPWEYLSQDAADTGRFLKDRMPKLARQMRGVRPARAHP
ncbi:MAG: HepT-like ribonuclease domain-containing protein [Thermoplasmata archaeon]